MNKFYLLLLLTNILFISCKTASKAYESGNYADAIQIAIKKLQKDPNDGVTKSVLQNAYTEAVRRHEEQIRNLSNSNSENRWDHIYNEYKALQQLYETVRPFPSLADAVHAVDYTDFLNTYSNKAADAHRDRGLALLNSDDKAAQREAYQEFDRALKYRPHDAELKKQRQQAYENAVVNVLIVPLDNYGGYLYSNSYQIRNFQNDLLRNLTFQSNNNFVRFYSEWENRGRNMRPDQVVELRMGRFDLGRPYDEQYTRDVSKEVVEKEIVYKPDSVVKQYRTVYARITTTRRTLVSEGELYLTIRDGNGRHLWSDNIRGEHRWQTEFATYTGDQRALSDNDRALLNRRSHNYIPREEEVMEELLRRIESETVYRLRNYYNRYQ
ncbi:MAG: hypothetical protein ICV84_23640 [Flavisolibacter sp.]|nr:hypothetical protein [Flavisolibacter sp.]